MKTPPRRLLWGLVLLLIALAACSGDAGPTGPDADLTVQGLNRAKLNLAVERIAAGDYGAIRSLLLYRNDELVVEEYFRGNTVNTRDQIYSVTKSVTSALVGMALAEGRLAEELDANLLGLYAEYDEVMHRDARKEAIRLEDALTMTAGFTWDEWSVPYGDPQNDASRLGQSADWMKYVLDLPMTAAPGTRFTYNSGVSMLLSGVIERAVSQTADAYAEATLFDALGITVKRWDETPGGHSNTGWGLHLTARDLAKFGLLFLAEGRWNGLQVVPEDWVHRSTAAHIATNNGLDYGYQWWRFRDASPTIAVLETNDVFFGWGYGGQFVFVIPHLDMVIVTTAANFEDGTQAFALLRDHLFPAVED